MWFAQETVLEGRPEPIAIGTRMGSSGLRRVPSAQAAESINIGETKLSDYLLVSGLVCFEWDEMRTLLSTGQLAIVEDARPLWPQVWALADARNVEDDVYSEGGALLSDGTGVWWAAAQLEKAAAVSSSAEQPSATGDRPSASGGMDALLAGLQAMPPAHLADEALAEWLRFFAGHKGRDKSVE